jgi:UDP-N-acetylglucosamine acyltransferase
VRNAHFRKRGVMARIHATAIVAATAELAEDVEVGAYSIVGPKVRIGDGTTLASHVVIEGRTTIGRNNRFHPFCVIGGPPQDKKYAGEDTSLEVGDGNTVREMCTFSLGTPHGSGVTRVGSHSWFMASSHVAHDCTVGDHVIFANNVSLAGHVDIGDHVILGGMVGVHQFCSVGAHAMAGGGTIVLRDIPPYVICTGNPATPHGINVNGLRRRGFDAETLNLLRRSYKIVYREGHTVAEAVAELGELAAHHPHAAAAIDLLKEFIRDSQRGIIR